MIDDAEQIRDENRDATPADAGDLIGRGIRTDPTLPPMTPTSNGEAREDARPMPDEEPDFAADDAARLVGRDEEQVEAARALGEES